MGDLADVRIVFAQTSGDKIFSLTYNIVRFFFCTIDQERYNFFSAGYFSLRYFLARFFFLSNQSTGYLFLKSPIPPPPPLQRIIKVGNITNDLLKTQLDSLH